MLIVNGSPNLVKQGSLEISIANNEIRLGGDDRVIWPIIGIVLGGFFGFICPGPFWIYWILGIGIGRWSIKDDPDKRPFYKVEDIEILQVLGKDKIVRTESWAGSSLAEPDTVEETVQVGIKFKDGEWLVGEGSSAEQRTLLMIAGKKNRCTF